MKDPDLRKILQSFIIPLFVLVLIWLVFITEEVMGYSFHFLGVYPLHWKGLHGIITAPLVHSDFSHAFSNSVPLLILGAILFYWYRPVSFRVLFILWIGSGIFVWLLGRPSWHIGASGLAYGLASFLFTMGIISKNPRLYSISLAVIFIYGSMVWGVFPDFFPKQNISWEAHAAGLLLGVVLAFVYRSSAPKREVYSWELEEPEPEEEPEKDSDIVIKYDIRPGVEDQKR